MIPANVEVFKTADALMRACAEQVVDAAARAVQERGAFSLVLSGGETPAAAYRLLGGESYASGVRWSSVHVLFADERTVPPTDPASNYGMVNRELLSRVPIPEANVHRLQGERDPQDAARAYAEEVQRVLGLTGGVADLILLGMGEDGHTASLFPGTAAVNEEHASVVAVDVQKLSTWRLTMTLPFINAAREIRVLVSGTKKVETVKRVFETRAPNPDLPITLVRPASGGMRWLMDAEAAKMLT